MATVNVGIDEVYPVVLEDAAGVSVEVPDEAWDRYAAALAELNAASAVLYPLLNADMGFVEHAGGVPDEGIAL